MQKITLRNLTNMRTTSDTWEAINSFFWGGRGLTAIAFNSPQALSESDTGFRPRKASILHGNLLRTLPLISFFLRCPNIFLRQRIRTILMNEV